MAERLYNEHVGSNGDKFKLSIYDSDFSSTAHTFFSNGFELSYKGEGEPLYNPLRPSEVSFIVYNTDIYTQSLIDDVKVSHEEQFLVLIQIYDKVLEAYRKWWTGILIHDILTIPDVDVEQVQFTAIDGLNRLEKLTLIEAAPTIQQYNTISEYIINILSSLPTVATFYTTSDEFLYIATNWYEAQMTTGASTNTEPFEMCSLNLYLFGAIEENELIYKDCKYILTQLLTQFNCIIKQSNGVFHVIQTGLLNTAGFTYSKYKKVSPYFINTGSYDTPIYIDQINFARADSDFQFNAPVKSISKKYEFSPILNGSQEMQINITPPQTWNPTINSSGTFYSVNFIAIEQSLKILINTKYYFYNNNSNAYLQTTTGGITAYYAYIIYWIAIKLTDGVDTYFLEQSSGSEGYKTPEWTDSPTQFLNIITPQFITSNDNVLGKAITIEPSNDTPIEGDITMEIRCYIRYYNNGFLTNEVNPNLSVNTLNVHVWQADFTISDSRGYDKFEIKNEVSGTLYDSQKIELESTIIGDGYYTNSGGALLIYPDNDQSVNWQIGGSGTQYNINDLHLVELMNYYELPLQILTGTIYLADGSDIINFHNILRLHINSVDEFYLMNGGSFLSNESSYNVELIKIKEITDRTVEPKVSILEKQNFSEKIINDSFSEYITRIPGDVVLYDDGTIADFKRCIEKTSGAYDSGKFEDIPKYGYSIKETLDTLRAMFIDGIQATYIKTNCSTRGGSDGSIVLDTISGGLLIGGADYTFLWSNSATTDSIYSLTAGVYDVTITDSIGQNSNFGFIVTEP